MWGYWSEISALSFQETFPRSVSPDTECIPTDELSVFFKSSDSWHLYAFSLSCSISIPDQEIGNEPKIIVMRNIFENMTIM